MTVLIASLKVGDHFMGINKVEAVKLATTEPTTDMFGRDMLRFWAKRLDTETEGWMTFGPEGVTGLVVR